MRGIRQGAFRAFACSIFRPRSPVRIARGCWPTWARRSSRSRPAEGETMRTRPPLRNGCSTVFGQLNVGKKSLVLDLKSPDAIDVIRRLVASADILVENFRPGVMRRLKLDYGSLQRTQSETDLLLDLRIRPDRAVGRTAGLRAGDPRGLRLRHGPSCRISPGEPGPTIAASITPMSSPASMPSARFRRRCTSASAAARGQHIDVSMLESMLSLTLERSAVVAIRGERRRAARCSARSRPRTDM